MPTKFRKNVWIKRGISNFVLLNKKTLACIDEYSLEIDVIDVNKTIKSHE